MGAALAESAWRRGAHVTLIAGHMDVPAPSGVELVAVTSAAGMKDAVADRIRKADVLIMAAAPADFRPAKAATQKIKKGGTLPTIQLEPADDILKSTSGSRKKGAIVVGFALETQNLLENAASKLEAKALDMIVANDATEEGAGFGVSTNRVTLLTKDGTQEELPLMSKAQVADAIVDRIAKLIDERSR
jgi:phosphopantothenoylcysteine decarboxylase/phosphopantothenate--cysteine ligase